MTVIIYYNKTGIVNDFFFKLLLCFYQCITDILTSTLTDTCCNNKRYQTNRYILKLSIGNQIQRVLRSRVSFVRKTIRSQW